MWWDSFWHTFTLWLYISNLVIAISISILLILSKQNPTKTLSWIIVMILLPYLGIILFLFFGRNFRKEKMFNRKGAGDLRIRKEMCRELLQEIEGGNLLPQELQQYRKFIIQNLKSSHSLLTVNSGFQIYFSGKDSLKAMCKAMEGAKKHIHLQSFIIEDDKVGTYFKDLLVRKAKEGVEVRLMYDGFGSRKLKKEFIQELKDAGVEILIFSPFRWLFPPLIVNYRNHRKILVVDGKTGFLGGVNIADRYFNGGEFPEWRDTHLKLIGESVYSLQASFLLDRFFILNKNIRKRNKYYPDLDIPRIHGQQEKKIYAQIISSGPDSDWSGIMQCYFSAITRARDHIYIVSPYFIPTETLLNALKITALSSVEISLMIPERSDTWLSNWSTRSYFSELLEAGIHIYLFKRGFNHSKVLSIDGEFCIIGSANIDPRSLIHHFEVTSVLYNQECAGIVENRFKKDLSRCTLITAGKWKKRPVKEKIYESIARLVSPLL